MLILWQKRSKYLASIEMNDSDVVAPDGYNVTPNHHRLLYLSRILIPLHLRMMSHQTKSSGYGRVLLPDCLILFRNSYNMFI